MFMVVKDFNLNTDTMEILFLPDRKGIISLKT